MVARAPLICAVEGIDGAGKSTFVATLGATLTERLTVQLAHTPGPSLAPLALALRSPNSAASFLAYMIGNSEAARLCGDVAAVVLDRYLLSTLVHHGPVLETWRPKIEALVSAIALPLPALTIILDVDPVMAANRIAARTCDLPLMINLEEQRRRYRLLAKAPDLRPFMGRTLVRENSTQNQLRDTVQEVVSLIEREHARSERQCI